MLLMIKCGPTDEQTYVADTLWSVHVWLITPICWESAMQNSSLSYYENCCLLQIKNTSNISRIRLTVAWERAQEQNQTCKLSPSLLKEREDQAQKKPRQKRDSHFRYCATVWNTAETVLGLWTSSMYTPTKLTNCIYKKWSNFRIMGIRPLNVTKNRKVLWPVTWLFDYKKADFWLSNQFAFLWIKNSFFGLPCLEFVILWSKTGSAQKGAPPEG